MVEIIRKNCSACPADAPLISHENLRALMPEIPYRDVVVVNNVMRLTRHYKFKKFCIDDGFF